MAEVNWSLVRRVANRVARVRVTDEIADLPAGVPVEEAARRVSAYTGIEIPSDLPARQTLSRNDWIVVALDRERLELASRESPKDSRSKWWELGNIASKLRSCSRDWRSLELGIQIGHDATSTMGEYFHAPKRVTVTPRLLLIAPNVARQASSRGIDLEELVSSVIIHEVTHVLQFAGIPWLQAYLEDVENRLRKLNGQPGASGDELRALKEQVVVLGEVMEGHAEHVTGVIDAEMLSLPSVEAMMPRWLRRATKLAGYIQKLVPGLRRVEVEVHDSPYKAALDFCNFVAKAGAFAELFQSPETLPNAAELADPEQWLARIQQ